MCLHLHLFPVRRFKSYPFPRPTQNPSPLLLLILIQHLLPRRLISLLPSQDPSVVPSLMPSQKPSVDHDIVPSNTNMIRLAMIISSLPFTYLIHYHFLPITRLPICWTVLLIFLVLIILVLLNLFCCVPSPSNPLSCRQLMFCLGTPTMTTLFLYMKTGSVV